MMIHAVVPVKVLSAAKQRLAHLLGPAERQALSLAMLDDVLAALGETRDTTATIISRDSRAMELALARGAAAISDHTSDLNAALMQAARQLPDAAAMLVVPSDLPLVRPDDIAALACAFDEHHTIVMAPAHDGGTNALLLRPGEGMPFLFGPDSLARHMIAAAELGLRARLVRLPHLEHDIDDMDDLVWLARQPGESMAQRLAREFLADSAI